MSRLMETPVRTLFNARAIAEALLAVAVMAVFCLSSMALTAVGISYDSPSGAIWQKLHPATYIAALALAFAIFGQARPLAFLEAKLATLPGAAFFLVLWILLILYAALVQKSPITAVIDPYFIALVALFMHDDLSSGARDFLRRFLHAIFCVNALIGLAELVSRHRLFPYVLMGEEVEGDYRSTALLGHPLLNASSTGAYILCLFLGGDKSLSFPRRALLLLPQILSMIAFGGRTAIVASSFIISFCLLRDFAKVLLGARFDMRLPLGFVIASPLALGFVVFMLFSGALDDLLGRFTDDNGSAEARVIMMKLFDLFEVSDLMLGPRPDLVDSALNTLGIKVGIENTWIALIFQYGALMTGFFAVAMMALFWEVWRRARAGATLLFVFFLIVISSAIGLASKTMMFVEFALTLLFIFPKDGDAARLISKGRDQVLPPSGSRRGGGDASE